MSDKRKVRRHSGSALPLGTGARGEGIRRTSPHPNPLRAADGDNKLRLIGLEARDSQRGARMLEAEATADMLLMTQPFTARQASERPIEVVLVEAVLSGERDRFARLYEMYAPMVHGILLARVPRGEVDDLVQDIFLHALRKLHTLREATAFGPWIAMIARNRAMDFNRSSRETVEVTEQMAVERPPNRTAKEILELICRLPEAYRETLVLRFVEGMTGPEIAARTGLTPASVRVTLHL